VPPPLDGDTFEGGIAAARLPRATPTGSTRNAARTKAKSGTAAAP